MYESLEEITEGIEKNRDTIAAKVKRTVTSALPVSKQREGECYRCGECCKLVYKCSFLDYDNKGKSMCKIYSLRPLNCRKYPRIAAEHITKEKCGYSFKNKKL